MGMSADEQQIRAVEGHTTCRPSIEHVLDTSEERASSRLVHSTWRQCWMIIRDHGFCAGGTAGCRVLMYFYGQQWGFDARRRSATNFLAISMHKGPRCWG